MDRDRASSVRLLTGLTAWWKLDETAGNSRLDSSGNGKTLTETGGTVGTVTGVIGLAATFTGVGTHYLDRAASLFTAAPFSVAAWINPTDFASTYDWVMQSFSGTQRQGIQTSSGTGVVQFVTGGTIISSLAALTAGVWQHVACTNDGTTSSVYINGTLNNSGASTPNFTSVNRTNIGARGNGGLGAVGSVDLAGYWTRVLTAAEVAALYNNGAGLDYGSFT